MKKLSVFLAVLLVFTSVFSVAASAVTLDDYKVSEEYQTSIFYKTVTDLPLTGDQRYDVVNVAITQVGYHEGDSDADMHGMSKGERNFVEYNRLYGKLDNGEGNGNSYGYMWCASFVSWVLRTANVDKKVAGEDVNCASWVSFFENKGQFKTRDSGYTPQAGDIIFYKGSRTSSRSNHVGIVVGCENGVVYTVEGNTGGIAYDGDPTNGGGVARKNYVLSDTYIVGYGVPRYQTKADVEYDFELFEINALSAGEYTVVSRNAKIVETPGDSKVLKRLSIGNTFEVTSVVGGYGQCTVDGVSGWVNLTNAIKTENAVHTISYVTDGGSEIASTDKDYGKGMKISSTVPEKQGFDFKGWAVREGGNVIYAPGDSYIYDLDATLYAVWEPNGEPIPEETENTVTDSATDAATDAATDTATDTATDAATDGENSGEIEQGGPSVTLIIILVAVVIIAAGAIVLAINMPVKKK